MNARAAGRPILAACIADLHGHLPEVPDCDLLLLGGDIVPASARTPHDAQSWLRDEFGAWLADLRARGIVTVGVAGNHDFLFEKDPGLVPPGLAWDYLQDSGIERLGLNIWGSPWQPRFFDWAFNLDEPDLRAKWDLIPDDTDVVLLHGPPAGAGDRGLGSVSLRYRIEEIRPLLVVCGHIHEGRGVHAIGPTTVVNAARVDEQYRPVHDPILIELPA